jgi:protein PhnA
MNIENELQARSGSKCELCSSDLELKVYPVPPDAYGIVDKSILICSTCLAQIEDPDLIDVNHWRCLNESMWSVTPAVQVMAWRMLNRIKSVDWPQDLLEMLYLDDETLAWAKEAGDGKAEEEVRNHVDSNGNILQSGDSVVLIKNLDVKGANFTAKRGTAVRNIGLVKENIDHIEGKVNGQQIVILTKYVKKSG